MTVIPSTPIIPTFPYTNPPQRLLYLALYLLIFIQLIFAQGIDYLNETTYDMTDQCIENDCTILDNFQLNIPYNHSYTIRLNSVYASDILSLSVNNIDPTINKAPLSVLLLDTDGYRDFITRNTTNNDTIHDMLHHDAILGSHFPKHYYPFQHEQDLQLDLTDFFVLNHDEVNIVFLNENDYYTADTCPYSIGIRFHGFGCLYQLGFLSLLITLVIAIYVTTRCGRNFFDKYIFHFCWCCWWDDYNTKYQETAHKSWRMRRQEYWLFSLSYHQAEQRLFYERTHQHPVYLRKGSMVDNNNNNNGKMNSKMSMIGQNNNITPTTSIMQDNFMMESTYTKNNYNNFISNNYTNSAFYDNNDNFTNNNYNYNNNINVSTNNQTPDPFSIPITPQLNTTNDPTSTTITTSPTSTLNDQSQQSTSPLPPPPTLPDYPTYMSAFTQRRHPPQQLSQQLYLTTNGTTNSTLTTQLINRKPLLGLPPTREDSIFSIKSPMEPFIQQQIHEDELPLAINHDMSLFIPLHIRNALDRTIPINPNPFQHQSLDYIHQFATKYIPVSFIDPVYYNNTSISTYAPMFLSSLEDFDLSSYHQIQFVLSLLYADAPLPLEEEYFYPHHSLDEYYDMNNDDGENDIEGQNGMNGDEMSPTEVYLQHVDEHLIEYQHMVTGDYGQQANNNNQSHINKQQSIKHIDPLLKQEGKMFSDGFLPIGQHHNMNNNQHTMYKTNIDELSDLSSLNRPNNNNHNNSNSTSPQIQKRGSIAPSPQLKPRQQPKSTQQQMISPLITNQSFFYNFNQNKGLKERDTTLAKFEQKIFADYQHLLANKSSNDCYEETTDIDPEAQKKQLMHLAQKLNPQTWHLDQGAAFAMKSFQQTGQFVMKGGKFVEKQSKNFVHVANPMNWAEMVQTGSLNLPQQQSIQQQGDTTTTTNSINNQQDQQQLIQNSTPLQSPQIESNNTSSEQVQIDSNNNSNNRGIVGRERLWTLHEEDDEEYDEEIGSNIIIQPISITTPRQTTTSNDFTTTTTQLIPIQLNQNVSSTNDLVVCTDDNDNVDLYDDEKNNGSSIKNDNNSNNDNNNNTNQSPLYIHPKLLAQAELHDSRRRGYNINDSNDNDNEQKQDFINTSRQARSNRYQHHHTSRSQSQISTHSQPHSTTNSIPQSNSSTNSNEHSQSPSQSNTSHSKTHHNNQSVPIDGNNQYILPTNSNHVSPRNNNDSHQLRRRQSTASNAILVANMYDLPVLDGTLEDMKPFIDRQTNIQRQQQTHHRQQSQSGTPSIARLSTTNSQRSQSSSTRQSEQQQQQQYNQHGSKHDSTQLSQRASSSSSSSHSLTITPQQSVHNEQVVNNNGLNVQTTNLVKNISKVSKSSKSSKLSSNTPFTPITSIQPNNAYINGNINKNNDNERHIDPYLKDYIELELTDVSPRNMNIPSPQQSQQQSQQQNNNNNGEMRLYKQQLSQHSTQQQFLYDDLKRNYDNYKLARRSSISTGTPQSKPKTNNNISTTQSISSTNTGQNALNLQNNINITTGTNSTNINTNTNLPSPTKQTMNNKYRRSSQQFTTPLYHNPSLTPTHTSKQLPKRHQHNTNHSYDDGDTAGIDNDEQSDLDAHPIPFSLTSNLTHNNDTNHNNQHIQYNLHNNHNNNNIMKKTTMSQTDDVSSYVDPFSLSIHNSTHNNNVNMNDNDAQSVSIRSNTASQSDVISNSIQQPHQQDNNNNLNNDQNEQDDDITLLQQLEQEEEEAIEMKQLLEYGFVIGNTVVKNRINDNIKTYISRSFHYDLYHPYNNNINTNNNNNTYYNRQDSNINSNTIITSPGEHDIQSQIATTANVTTNSTTNSISTSNQKNIPQQQPSSQQQQSEPIPREYLYIGDLTHLIDNIETRLPNLKQTSYYYNDINRSPEEQTQLRYSYRYNSIPSRLDYLFHITPPKLSGYGKLYEEIPWCLLCCNYRPYQRTTAPRITMSHPFSWWNYDTIQEQLVEKQFNDKFKNKDINNDIEEGINMTQNGTTNHNNKNDKKVQTRQDRSSTKDSVQSTSSTGSDDNVDTLYANYAHQQNLQDGFEIFDQAFDADEITQNKNKQFDITKEQLYQHAIHHHFRHQRGCCYIGSRYKPSTTSSSAPKEIVQVNEISTTSNNNQNDINATTDLDGLQPHDSDVLHKFYQEQKQHGKGVTNQYNAHNDYNNTYEHNGYNDDDDNEPVAYYGHDVKQNNNIFDIGNILEQMKIPLPKKDQQLSHTHTKLDSSDSEEEIFTGNEQFFLFTLHETFYQKIISCCTHRSIYIDSYSGADLFDLPKIQQYDHGKQQHLGVDLGDDFFGQPICYCPTGTSFCASFSTTSTLRYEELYISWRNAMVKQINFNTTKPFNSINHFEKQSKERHEIEQMEANGSIDDNNNDDNIQQTQQQSQQQQSPIFTNSTTSNQQPQSTIGPQQPQSIQHESIPTQSTIPGDQFHITLNSKIDIVVHDTIDPNTHQPALYLTRAINVRQNEKGLYILIPPPHILDIYHLSSMESDQHKYQHGWYFYSANNYYTIRDDETLPMYLRLHDLQQWQRLEEMHQNGEDHFIIPHHQSNDNDHNDGHQDVHKDDGNKDNVDDNGENGSNDDKTEDANNTNIDDLQSKDQSDQSKSKQDNEETSTIDEITTIKSTSKEKPFKLTSIYDSLTFTDVDILKFDPKLYHINIITDYNSYFEDFVCTNYLPESLSLIPLDHPTAPDISSMIDSTQERTDQYQQQQTSLQQSHSTYSTNTYQTTSTTTLSTTNPPSTQPNQSLLELNQYYYESTHNQNSKINSNKNKDFIIKYPIISIPPNIDPHYYTYKSMYQKRLLRLLQRYTFTFPHLRKTLTLQSHPIDVLRHLSAPIHTISLSTQNKPTVQSNVATNNDNQLQSSQQSQQQQQQQQQQQSQQIEQNDNDTSLILPSIFTYDTSKYLYPPTPIRSNWYTELIYNLLPSFSWSRIPMMSHKIDCCETYTHRPRVDFAHWWRSRIIYFYPFNPGYDEDLMVFRHRLILVFAIILFNLCLFISFAGSLERVVANLLAIVSTVPIVDSKKMNWISYLLTANFAQSFVVVMSSPFLAFAMLDCERFKRSYDFKIRLLGWIIYLLFIIIGTILFCGAIFAFSLVLYTHRCDMILESIFTFLITNLFGMTCVWGIPMPILYILLQLYGAIPRQVILDKDEVKECMEPYQIVDPNDKNQFKPCINPHDVQLDIDLHYIKRFYIQGGVSIADYNGQLILRQAKN